MQQGLAATCDQGDGLYEPKLVDILEAIEVHSSGKHDSGKSVLKVTKVQGGKEGGKGTLFKFVQLVSDSVL